MAKLHMICGLPCSGKTTLARKLEAELPALRFSPDEWLEPFIGARDWDKDVEAYNQQRLQMEAMLLDFALRAVSQGINAILDNGFWGREERDTYRTKARERGINVKLHYMDVSREELLLRLKKRNDDLKPGIFYITESQLVEWLGRFQPPDADELSE
ncbi:MAG TPA: ATP-binding protein [Rickettsiales bacterium]|nr:ATP-binding protein [Rickettsiales bacterium]